MRQLGLFCVSNLENQTLALISNTDLVAVVLERLMPFNLINFNAVKAQAAGCLWNSGLLWHVERPQDAEVLVTCFT